jgi:threonylcarbamoyladenosine tRNA methylthiotransferase MtaB
MRVYLESLGCRLNYAEMTGLGRQLVEAGHELAASASDADLCVLNSCAVTGEAARKSRQLVRQLAQINPRARLVVTGCYATLEGEATAALPNVELVVGNARKDQLLGLIASRAVDSPIAPRDAQVPHLQTGGGELGRTRAFVKVQDGCHNHCTFCIVTVARGDERSRPAAEVAAEINRLHQAGYQEAVLTGVHLGGYGRDRGTDLRSLMMALLEETAIPRLRLSSLEPFDLDAGFFALWGQSGGRLMPHLHLPVQSGSDTVLRRMARRNRVADFEALVSAARVHIPGLTLTTDLIAGFPGEGEEQFDETVAFARRVEFAHMHAFSYSARAGTAAARFAGQVPEAERRRRSRLLNELNSEVGRSVRENMLGQVRPVLWENRSPRPDAGPSPAGTEVWSGLTDNYLRVRIAAPQGLDLHNRITQTRLVSLVGDELQGQMICGQ